MALCRYQMLGYVVGEGLTYVYDSGLCICPVLAHHGSIYMCHRISEVQLQSFVTFDTISTEVPGQRHTTAASPSGGTP